MLSKHQGPVSKRKRFTFSLPTRALAEVVKNGLTLDWCVEEWANSLPSLGLPRANPQNALGVFSVASTCTGSGSDHYIAAAVEQVLRRAGFENTSINIVAMAEISNRKREYLLNNVQVNCCLFGDISTVVMNKGYGRCYKHNRECRFPDFDILLSGFSCKGWSPQNNHESNPAALLSNPLSQSSTYITYWANMGLIDLRNPWAVIFENLDVMDQEPNAAGASSGLPDTQVVGHQR
jgi:hypothetical protein